MEQTAEDLFIDSDTTPELLTPSEILSIQRQVKKEKGHTKLMRFAWYQLKRQPSPEDAWVSKIVGIMGGQRASLPNNPVERRALRALRFGVLRGVVEETDGLLSFVGNKQVPTQPFRDMRAVLQAQFEQAGVNVEQCQRTDEAHLARFWEGAQHGFGLALVFLADADRAWQYSQLSDEERAKFKGAS